MEEEIYKINELSINQEKTEFCLCYNNGLKTFDLETFEENNSSNNFQFKLGSISLSILTPQENTVIFVGSQYNKNYPNNKIVFFDINDKKELFSKSFDKEITNIKYVNNFLYICFGIDLKIYSYTNNTLELKDEYTLSEEYINLFEVWETKEANNLITKIFLSYPYKKQLIILFNTADDWKLGNKNNIDSPVNKIQNLFFIKKLNQLFIADENGIYIYGFDVDDGSTKICLRRGSNPGVITSITFLNNNFLAINNINRTIHIFDLDINNNAFSFSNIVYNWVYGMQEIYPCLRIYYKDIIVGKEGEYNKSDFDKKGALLVSEDNGNELNVISYNGYAYKISINFKELKYKVIKKQKYTEVKNLLLKEGKVKNLSLYNSYNAANTEDKKDEK
jgi:hypothetical protein